MSRWGDELGTVGFWRQASGVGPELAAQVEALGYGAIWLGGSPASDLRHAEELLSGTERIVIATGIVNIWNSDPTELADSFFRVEETHPGRLLLGIGSGHREATPQRSRPLEAMNRYLDVLDERGVPVGRRVLSALGPRMLAVAKERSGGTHPYLTVPAQTAEARIALGSDALIAPEQTVVFDSNPATARVSARAFLANYLRMVNYTSNMLRAGFDEGDIGEGGSDRLVDAIVVHGDDTALAGAVREHLDNGADHVCVQVVPAADDPLPALRALARRLQLS